MRVSCVTTEPPRSVCIFIIIMMEIIMKILYIIIFMDIGKIFILPESLETGIARITIINK